MPFESPDERPELTAEEIEAMAETVARMRMTVAEIVARERQQVQGLVDGGYLTREGMNAATESLGIPAVSDQEWNELRKWHGGPG